MKKILNFLFNSYHRPSAKVEHFLMLLMSLLLNNSAKTFSERMMLLKVPPHNLLYYNYFGRSLIIIFNFFTIIFFKNFFSKDMSLENKEIPKEGSDLIYWPIQPYHFFENDVDLDDDFLNKLSNEYKLCKNELIKNNLIDSPWWKLCRDEFKNIFLLENEKVNENNLINFRNNLKTKAALLSDQNFINTENSKIKNMILSLDLFNLYHKLSEQIDLSILRSASESSVGNSICPNYRGQRLSHRVLRHAYYTSQIEKHCKELSTDNIICDIGGGYGGLIRFLRHRNKSNTYILIELPEVCLLANYFLKKCFPESSIGTISDFKDLQSITRENLRNYDFVILPQTFMEKFDKKSIDLFINTTSLGEMDNKSQQFYLDNIERIEPKYFYSVNRAKKRIDKYDAGGFYNLSFNQRWKSIIYRYTHTYHLEFLGEFVENKKTI